MNIMQEVAQLVGNTPLLRLTAIEKEYGAKAAIIAKMECMNPAGSIKDRTALFMLRDGIERGLVKRGSVIVEPTSGNTGIGLASACARAGIKLILTMPETMSVERRNLLSAYGAEIVLTPASKGMRGAIEKAQEIVKSTPDAYTCGQFDNAANVRAHYQTTAPEIWRDTDGDVDAVVAGIGTGGTVTGIAKYLKEKNKKIKVFGVEPFESPFLTQGRSGAHGIQGIGAGFAPKILDLSIVDSVFAIKTHDAYRLANAVAKKEGVLVGISSGAALQAAIDLAQKDEWSGKNIVVIFPDSGERYLSCNLYD